MCWQAEQYDPISHTTPQQARHFTAKHLLELPGGVVPAHLIQTAELVVSELVTNAVNAGSRGTTVAVAVHHNHIRIAVDDDSPGRPAMRPAATHDLGGR